MKLAKSTFPHGHSESDFSCCGPVAEHDGEFDNACLVDMGCFNQDGKDSNKFVHASVAQSKINGSWYLYTTWGRTGSSNNQFLFEEFGDKNSAQYALAAYAHSKNDRRGEFRTIAGLRTLVAKPGKDVYKVQSLQSRSTGLPDAKNITTNAGLKEEKIRKLPANTSKTKIDIDPQSAALLKDLRVGTVSFTRSSLEGGNVPTQSAIDEGREVLTAALKRLGKIGDDLQNQVRDKQVRELTYHLYSRIPKKKDLRTDESMWILSKQNILSWQQNLDAFENAIYASTETETTDNPYGELSGILTMQWLPPSSEIGRFLYEWIPNASANRHAGVGKMAIKNIWKIDRAGDKRLFETGLKRCKVDRITEKAPFQPTKRLDLTAEETTQYAQTNTALLFHGTRSVNVGGILRTMLRNPRELKGVAISGAAYGVAVAYTADDWRKSAGYTSLDNSYWSSGGGRISGRSAFMFLLDSTLGRPYVAPHSGAYSGPPDNHHCIFAKAGKSGVMNNEWIIFDRDQLLMRYLIEFETK